MNIKNSSGKIIMQISQRSFHGIDLSNADLRDANLSGHQVQGDLLIAAAAGLLMLIIVAFVAPRPAGDIMDWPSAIGLSAFLWVCLSIALTVAKPVLILLIFVTFDILWLKSLRGSTLIAMQDWLALSLFIIPILLFGAVFGKKFVRLLHFGLDFGDANLQDSNINGGNLTLIDLTNANLQNAKLPGAKLKYSHLAHANFSGTDLEGANLEACHALATDFSKASMKKTNLIQANLSHANLSFADLSQADLTRSQVQKTIFSNANLCGAKLLGVNLQSAELQNVDFDKYTVWPTGFLPPVSKHKP